MPKAEPTHIIPDAIPATSPAGANVLPFPPTVRDARDVAQTVEAMPAGMLLPVARRALALAETRTTDRTMTTANANAIWTALLCCARLLDNRSYPVIAALAGAAGDV